MPQNEMEKPEATFRNGGKEREANGRLWLHDLRFSQEQETVLFGSLGEDSFFVVRDSRFKDIVDSIDRKKLIGLLSTKGTVRDVIAARYRGFAWHLANEVSAIGLPAEERLGAAIEGIYNAVDEFDPEKGYPFYKFSTFRVVRAVQRSARENLSLTEREYRDLSKSLRVKGAFRNVFQREPVREELRLQLLANTDISVNHIAKSLEIIFDRRTKSLSQPLKSATNRLLSDVVPSDTMDVGEMVTDAAEKEETVRVVNHALERLSPDEKALVARFLSGEELSDVFSPQLQAIILKLRQDEGIKQLKSDDESSGKGKQVSQLETIPTSIRDAQFETDEEKEVELVEIETEAKNAVDDIKQEAQSIDKQLAAANNNFEKVVILAKARINRREIARRVGISYGSVRTYIYEANKSGANIPPPYHRKEERRGRARVILNLVDIKRWVEEEGLTDREIAERLEVSRTTVNAFIVEHKKEGNITRPKRGKSKILKPTRRELAEAAKSEATELVRQELERDTATLAGFRVRPRRKVNKESGKSVHDPSEEIVIFTAE